MGKALGAVLAVAVIAVAWYFGGRWLGPLAGHITGYTLGATGLLIVIVNAARGKYDGKPSGPQRPE